MSIILDVSHLTKVYGRRTVLNDISFQVEHGASLAITGPSGCGKSTLLNIIGTLDTPTSGTIRLMGRALPPIGSGAAMRLRRKTINYLFQSFALIADQTAFANALLALHYAPISTAQKTKAIDQVFNRLGLSQVRNDKVSTLSGGEQQRLALARCMLKPGELILADEPTGSLDAHLAQTVLNEMMALKQEFGKTLIIVTHDPHIADACAHHLRLAPIV